MYNSIYDQTHPISSSYDTQSTSGDENNTPKRKVRRVRSLIKSSIAKLTHNSKTSTESTSPTLSMRRSSASSTTATDKRPFPFGQCRVCMDKATGAHYGVPTCEGCKVSFVAGASKML